MKRFIPFMPADPMVAVVRLSGIITSGRGLNDQSLAPLLDKAFSSKPKAVALSINSPGGSPVQSSLIGSRIRRLSEEKKTPVVAFVEDVAASGGYWLAAAADEIFVDESSVIGSIGVISSGFGLHELIGKNGIERRVYTAGNSKSMNDMFKPENPEDIAKLKVLLEDIHDNFKAHVSTRRAGKLPEDQDLFQGDIWVGQKGVDVGLADGIGHLVPTMKERFGKKTKFRVFEQRRRFASRLGLEMVDQAFTGLEERAAFARFGL